MIKFRTFLLEGKGIRQGLPKIPRMDYKQLGRLLSSPDNKLHLDRGTEKTDGTSIVVGLNEHGQFFTQSTGSSDEKMYTPEDYHVRGKRRAAEQGKEYNGMIGDRFGEAHMALSKNKALVADMQEQQKKSPGQPVIMRGELFHKDLAQSVGNEGHVRFVNTVYHPDKLNMTGRSVGSIIIHSQLPENSWIHNSDQVKDRWSNKDIGFGSDKIQTRVPPLDVSKHKALYQQLNHELLGKDARGKIKDKVLEQRQKVSEIGKKLDTDLNNHLKTHGIDLEKGGIFGPGTEGMVFHNKDIRFATISPEFKKFKQETKGMKLSDILRRGTK